MVAVDRIMEQVRGQMGINDKVLAEYLLAMAKQSKTAMEFEEKLKPTAGENAESLASSLFALVTKLMPEHFPTKN